MKKLASISNPVSIAFLITILILITATLVALSQIQAESPIPSRFHTVFVVFGTFILSSAALGLVTAYFVFRRHEAQVRGLELEIRAVRSIRQSLEWEKGIVAVPVTFHTSVDLHIQPQGMVPTVSHLPSDAPSKRRQYPHQQSVVR